MRGSGTGAREPSAAARTAIDRGGRCLGIPRFLGSGDLPQPPTPRLPRRALPGQSKVRRGVGQTVSFVGAGAAERSGPRRNRRPGFGRRARGGGERTGRGAFRDGRLEWLRGGRAPGDEAPGGASRDRSAGADAGPRAERRGVRELCRAGGAVRDDAASRAHRGDRLRHLAERHGRLDHGPDGLGPWAGAPHHPGRGERGGGRPRRHVPLGRRGSAHRARRHLCGDDARHRGHRAGARRAPGRGQARPAVRAGGDERGRAAFDRGPHGSAGRRRRAPRRVAARARSDADGGPGGDVRGNRAALVPPCAARARRRRRSAVRRRLHTVRGGRGRGGPRAPRVRRGHETAAPSSPAGLRRAEQPARRHRPGSSGDRDVRRRARGAGR